MSTLLRASGLLGVTGGAICSYLFRDGYDSENYSSLDAPAHVATGSHRKFEGEYSDVESCTLFSLDRGGY